MARALARLTVVVLAMGAALEPLGCGRTHSTVGAVVQYHCPMHPTVVSNKPDDCPICGMKLVPVEGVGGQTGASTNDGLAAVDIPEPSRKRMGLTWGSVERMPMVRETRASARIVPDETRLYHVNVKMDGYVERLFAATTGQHIRQGEPMLSIYSPELVSAQQEYLYALGRDAALAAAARKRLSLWDISDSQIDELARSGVPERTVVILAPADGWVLERNISVGHRVSVGEQLMVLADLSRVWADADLHQTDLPAVRMGMPVSLEVSALPGTNFEGRVTFVSPALDAATRTVRVRMEVPNDGLLLRPEMYAVARLSLELGERTAVPESAVMRTGTRDYVFRSADETRLEPVEIRLGVRSEGWFEVLDGLKAGERVVTSANFLVDSESSMKAALEALSGHRP